MEFSQDNSVVHLCSNGMELEGHGQMTEAASLFYQAWSLAKDDFEKFTAAHYVARHQKNASDKLAWDETALKHALELKSESVLEVLPSLYLNIGKCYEDLNDPINAKRNYLQASEALKSLPASGYMNMIKGGIENGLLRIG